MGMLETVKDRLPGLGDLCAAGPEGEELTLQDGRTVKGAWIQRFDAKVGGIFFAWLEGDVLMTLNAGCDPRGPVAH